jgi:hypothetical protein
MVCAVEYTSKSVCNIVILDARTGDEIKRLKNPDNNFIQTPKWSIDGKNIVYTKFKSPAGKSLEIINVDTEKETELIPPAHDNIYWPAADANYAYFVAPYSGIDNIYAVEFKTKKIFQVTSRLYGAYYPTLSPDGRKLAFNDVTSAGYMAMEMSLAPDKFIPIDKADKRPVEYSNPLIEQEAGRDITGDIPNTIYQTKPYYGLSGLISIHSWLPWYDLSNKLSFTVYSRNKMNTFRTSASYYYNLNEKSHAGEAAIEYAGWYPIIDISCFYGQRTSIYEDYWKYDRDFRWRELSPSIGLRVPFDLTRSRFHTNLLVGARARYVFTYDMPNILPYYKPEMRADGRFIATSYFATFSNGYFRFADINPCIGQTLNVIYKHTPFKGRYRGSLFSASGTLFFPGVWRNHSLFIQGGYERQTPHEYRFASEFLFPRGYEYEYSRALAKGSLNYLFPIYNADWNLFHIFHIKRFISNIFGDYGLAIKERAPHIDDPISIYRLVNSSLYYFLRKQSPSHHELYRSAGIEMYAEIHFFSIEVPLLIGTRHTFRFDKPSGKAPLENMILIGFGMDIERRLREPLFKPSF